MVDYKINRSAADTKNAIKRAIGQFSSGDLFENGLRLFETLGYNTERQSPLDQPSFAPLHEGNGVGDRMNPAKSHTANWREVLLLFQLTETEMNRQMGLFDSGRVNDTIIGS